MLGGGHVVCEELYITMGKLIGERSEPLSDKLGGEICIATRALVCIYIYMRTA